MPRRAAGQGIARGNINALRIDAKRIVVDRIDAVGVDGDRAGAVPAAAGQIFRRVPD